MCCCYLLAKLCWTLVTPCTIAHQAQLYLGFPRQEYWSGLPLPSPEDMLEPRIKAPSLALAARFSTAEHPGKPPPMYKLLITQVVREWIKSQHELEEGLRQQSYRQS